MLDDLCGKVKDYGKAVYVEIEGHTDSTGTDDYNTTLGLRRASTVRDYMHQAGGIPLHAINTISLGEGTPVRVHLVHPRTAATLAFDGRVANQTRCDHGVIAVGIEFQYALDRVDEGVGI